ncbi:MAG: hypothetical protein ACRCTR_00460 [Actinomycetota bacterium]
MITSEGTSVPVVRPKNAKAVRPLVSDGSDVAAGFPVLEATYPGFAIRATVPPDRIYRFLDGVGGMRAQITNGPGPFSCEALGDLTNSTTSANIEQAEPQLSPPVSPEPGDAVATEKGAGISEPDLTSSGGVSLTCAAPISLRLLTGSPALLAVATGTSKDAVVVPVEAVAGLTQQGTVGLVESGIITQRTVTLGLTDGRYIEVLAGLNEGDRVALPAPSS